MLVLPWWLQAPAPPASRCAGPVLTAPLFFNTRRPVCLRSQYLLNIHTCYQWLRKFLLELDCIRTTNYRGSFNFNEAAQ